MAETRKKGSCLKKVAIFIVAIAVLGFAGKVIYGFATRVPTRDPGKKVVIIGLDGAYYEFVDTFMKAGALPNFQKLADQGVFMPLGTSNPPESPVAWSSFATSTNPGKHGIYDFLRKKDRENPWPDLAGVSPVPAKFWKEWLPIRMPKATNMRQGKTFWGLMAEDGLRTVCLQTAVTFPPEQLPNGYMMSGLNVPDIRGTQATFTFLTSDANRVKETDTEFGGKVNFLAKEGEGYKVDIVGPWNPVVQSYKYESGELKKQIDDGMPDAVADLKAKRDTITARVKEMEAAGEDELSIPATFKRVDETTVEMTLQDNKVTLKLNEWSPWQEVHFDVSSLVKINGIVKAILVQASPEVEVYLTPIDFNPAKPPIPISWPAGLSKDLVKALGHLYKTRGWAEETAGFKEGFLPAEAFIADMAEINNNLEAMTLHMMDNYKWDLLVSIFSGTDRSQHLMWHYADPNHPIYDAAAAAKYGDSIKNVYVRMDQMLGKVLERVEKEKQAGKDTTVFVISDHGFSPFYKGVNINTWLWKNGFMTPRGNFSQKRGLDQLFGGAEFFMDDKGWIVDWKQTKAYAIGLGQIFLNLKGREKLGSVSEAEREATCNAIRDGLLQLTDPETGGRVIREVYIGRETWHGDYVDSADGNYIAPDLQVGFERGYRVSWQTALGGIPDEIIEVNKEKWSGDHCSVDQSIVSGILLSNKKVALQDPDLMDMGTTVLNLMGTEKDRQMEGRDLFVAGPPRAATAAN